MCQFSYFKHAPWTQHNPLTLQNYVNLLCIWPSTSTSKKFTQSSTLTTILETPTSKRNVSNIHFSKLSLSLTILLDETNIKEKKLQWLNQWMLSNWQKVDILKSIVIKIFHNLVGLKGYFQFLKRDLFIE